MITVFFFIVFCFTDYTEKKIQGTKNTFLVARSKETLCVRVFPEWKGGNVKTSSAVCVDGMEQNKGTKFLAISILC